MPPAAQDVALELERLRGAMINGFTQIDVKFAEVNGKIDRLCERGERTDQDVADLQTRIAATEKRVWLLSGAAAVIGIVTPYIVQAIGK
jgi:hypothetical protein